MNEKVKQLSGANMDIDLTSNPADIRWEQTICPWNKEENTTDHKCAVKNTSICKYFCGIKYLDSVLCSYPYENKDILAEKMERQNITISEERISAEEYIEFLKRTDLGSQYPKERFEERIAKLVKNVSISLVARNKEGFVVGVLFGLTDFCYWLYITDLGVDRNYERRGIASRLMKKAHEIAGGEKDIAVYLIANENAVPFYQKLGMKFSDDVMQYNHIEWTEWTVE